MDFFKDYLDAEIVLDFGLSPHPSVRRVAMDTLPWAGTNQKIIYAVQEAICQHLELVGGTTWRFQPSSDLVYLDRHVVNELRTNLEEFGIRTIEKLAFRTKYVFRSVDKRILFEVPPSVDSKITYRPYSEYSNAALETIKVRGDIHFSPIRGDRRLTLVVSADDTIFLNAVELMRSGVMVCRNEVNAEVKRDVAEPSLVEVPLLPLSEYGTFHATPNDYSLRFVCDDAFKDVGLSESVMASCDSFEFEGDGTCDVFLDIGSTNSKVWFMSKDTCVPRLFATSDILEELGFSYEKRRLVDLFRGNDSAAVAYFKNVVELLVENVARSIRKQIDSVIWSIPNYSSGEFPTKLISDIKHAVDGIYILGKIDFISESECLRLRYEKPLRRLVWLTEERRAAISKAEEDNRRKDEIMSRISQEIQDLRVSVENLGPNTLLDNFQQLLKFKSKRIRKREDLVKQIADKNRKIKGLTEAPVPAFQEWMESLRQSRIDDNLRNIICLDAGGMSLDVFCASGAFTLCKSYEAGGQSVTRRLARGILDISADSPLDTELLNRAERTKIVQLQQLQNIPDYGTTDELLNELQRQIRKLTDEIYRGPVQEIADWLRNYVPADQGILVLLSGQASQNLFFWELLKEAFYHHKFVYLTRIDLLSNIIENDKGLSSDPTTQWLAQSSRAFHSVGEYDPDIAWDVVAGQYAWVRFADK